jgi:hypothetical protein
LIFSSDSEPLTSEQSELIQKMVEYSIKQDGESLCGMKDVGLATALQLCACWPEMSCGIFHTIAWGFFFTCQYDVAIDISKMRLAVSQELDYEDKRLVSVAI